MPKAKVKRGRPRIGKDRKVPFCVSVDSYVAESMKNLAKQWTPKVSTSELVNQALQKFIDTEGQR